MKTETLNRSVYLLNHIYKAAVTSTKFIGAFKDKLEAQSVIDNLWTKVGFCRYSKDCFILQKIKIDQIHWSDGYLNEFRYIDLPTPRISNQFVYMVEHIYEVEEDDEKIILIGVFSTLQKAKSACKYLRFKSGFAEHSKKCFNIQKVVFSFYWWRTGFITWEEAMEGK